MRTCVKSPDIENRPKHSAMHGCKAAAEWNDRTDRGAAPLQESHSLDGGRGGPSNIISSTKYDEDSNTANGIIESSLEEIK